MATSAPMLDRIPEHPGDILGQALDALGAVHDLLCSVTRGDLHQVDPNNLSALLDLIRARMVAAEAAINAPKQP